MLPILLILGGWVVFNNFIRPAHYQLLYPYSEFQFREFNITETRIGPDNRVEIRIPSGPAVTGKDLYQKEIFIDGFWIDQVPVTAADYKRFIYGRPILSPKYHDEYTPYWFNKRYELLPVVFIGWDQAEHYCEFYGGHLPTEAQWEKAARGTEGIILYWDENEKAFDKANYDDFYKGKTFSGWLPKGKTVYGLMDMSGNVREWGLDWVDYMDQSVKKVSWIEIKDGKHGQLGRILKGGSYIDDVSHLRLNSRDAHDPGSPGFNRGFRCVYEK